MLRTGDLRNLYVPALLSLSSARLVMLTFGARVTQAMPVLLRRAPSASTLRYPPKTASRISRSEQRSEFSCEPLRRSGKLSVRGKQRIQPRRHPWKPRSPKSYLLKLLRQNPASRKVRGSHGRVILRRPRRSSLQMECLGTPNRCVETGGGLWHF